MKPAANRRLLLAVAVLALDGLRKAAIIVVNAETAPGYALDRQENVPTVTQVLRAIRDIPTTYSLPASTVDRLRQFSGRALEASADYRRLLRNTDSR